MNDSTAPGSRSADESTHAAEYSSAEETPSPSILVQAGDAPVFNVVDGGDDVLVCEGCSQSVLVRGYLSECFVGVQFQCYGCGHVTKTPSLPAAGQLPHRMMNVGFAGRIFLNTIDVDRDTTWASHQEIEAAEARIRPKGNGEPLDFSVPGLQALAAQLDVVSGGRFKPKIASADRSLDHGREHFAEHPLAWAICYLIRQQKKGAIDFSREHTIFALGLVSYYGEMRRRWESHPLFPIVSIDLCGEFRHTMAMLFAALRITEFGNRVGIVQKDSASGPTADLYVQLRTNKRLYIEVKTPDALEWPKCPGTQHEIEKVVAATVKKIRKTKQIGLDRPGVLVIGSTAGATNMEAALQGAIRDELRLRGSGIPGIAGIIGVGFSRMKVSQLPDRLNLHAELFTFVEENPSYFDGKIFSTDRGSAEPVSIEPELRKSREARKSLKGRAS
jgi:hypothetical protein